MYLGSLHGRPGRTSGSALPQLTRSVAMFVSLGQFRGRWKIQELEQHLRTPDCRPEHFRN
jgi:hypothetical protein